MRGPGRRPTPVGAETTTAAWPLQTQSTTRLRSGWSRLPCRPTYQYKARLGTLATAMSTVSNAVNGVIACSSSPSQSISLGQSSARYLWACRRRGPPKGRCSGRCSRATKDAEPREQLTGLSVCHGSFAQNKTIFIIVSPRKIRRERRAIMEHRV